jgi:hypothetical protein
MGAGTQQQRSSSRARESVERKYRLDRTSWRPSFEGEQASGATALEA